MATESLLLTALPNGFREGGELLGVTVFVSPRLSTDGEPFLPLTKFPAFTDWPAALAQLRLGIQVENLGDFDTGTDPETTGLPDSAMWALVFGGDVGVITGEFKDLSEKKIRTFPAADVADYVLDLYTDVAEGYPLKFPPVTFGPLAPLADELGHLGDGRTDQYKRLDSLFADEQSHLVEGRHGRYIPPGIVPPTERRRLAFMQAYRFYDRFRNGQSVREPWGDIDPAKVPPPPKRPDYDFHGYVAAVGDYPLLLRPLGLAIDLVIKRDPQIQNAGRIRVRVDAPAELAWTTDEVARPWTNYELDDRRFIPRPRDREGELVDGTLRLESPRHFRVHQIDVDGSALKTVDFLGNVKRVKDHLKSVPRSMTPDESSLPALRGVGFTISRNDRAEQMVNRLDNAVLHDQDVTNQDPANLFAEDVTRGYRIDVEPNGLPFLSLCQRIGSYVVRTPNGDQPIPLDPDEGFLKGSSTTSVPGDDEELYLHEAVGSWGGWSIVAKRPGRRVMPDESLDDGSQPDEPDAGVPLVTAFRATPGTLPRLRYGEEYRMRARAVDLAGNSVREEGLDPQHVSPHETFFRWEPVPSPAVIPRMPYSEGESLMRMVVRSTLDVTTDAYVALPRVTSLPGHGGLHAYRIENERWIAPPKTSQQMAEFHGAFDPSIGFSRPQAAVDSAFDLAARESGTFMDDVPDAVVVNPSGATPTDLSTHKKGDPLEPGEYVRIDTDDLKTPYLPDVASRGVAFTTLPNDGAVNTPTRTITWPGGTDWHDRQPVRIRIEDGPAPTPVVPAGVPLAADWNDAARRLTVFVPQAEIVTVRLSSFLNKDPVNGADDLRKMGIWNRLSAAAQLAQDDDARHGRAWMLTPPETLVLVHAVEKPLLAPVVDVTDSGMQRVLGDTFCALAGSIDNHAKSTGRLDVDAVWSEQSDDVGKDLPDDGVDGRGLKPGLAHVGDFQLDSDEDDCRVGYHDAPRVATKPPVHQLRHELGDTKHRRVRYRATATTRFREYFPPEVIEGRDENGDRFILHAGAEKELIVPSSRRPEPPDILYIVPTFTWEEETLSGLLSQQFLATSTGTRRRTRAGGTTIGGVSTRIPRTFRRVRRGGGLRVYLRRGWFSSGDGEQLGVVLKDQPWLTWPIDIGAGMEVGPLAKLNADRVAQRLFERGAVKPKGRASLAPTERLVNALQPSTRTTSARRSRDMPAMVLAAEQFASIAHVIDEGMFGIFELLDPGIDPDKLITQWGSDPIWGSALPASGPYIHQFPFRTSVGTGLSLAETTRALATVVGHTPQFDPVRGLWYCDLQVDAGLSYFPFVRLGLCRYQPHSIPNAHISRVVRADYAQLVADRTCSLTKRGSVAHVTLRGPAGYSDIAQNLVGADPDSPLGMMASRRVTAQIERLGENADPDLGWRPVGDEILLEAHTTQGLGDVRWTGDVPIPSKPSGTQQRIAVCEFEVLETDESEKDATIMTGFFDFRPVRYRMVYADHLAL